MRSLPTLPFFALLFSLLACSPKIAQPELIDEVPTPAVKESSKLNILPVLIEKGNSFIGPCEPSICINPIDDNHIVAGAILDKVYVSKDGGKNWTSQSMSSSYGVYGDPVIRANYKGDFFYSHLADPDDAPYSSEAFLDRIVIQKSSDGGYTWSDGSYTLPRSPKDQDKQWMTVDPQTNKLYLTWTEFDLYASKESTHKSRILFSSSDDDGETWSDPLTLSQLEGDCLDDDQTTEGAVPDVGPDGQVYVAWAYDENIYFDKSYDGGKTWLAEDILATQQVGGWVIDIPGLNRCNGMPITRADRSNSPHRGTIYINYGEQKSKDNTEIMLVKSTDEGQTWSEPIKVNDDTSDRHQFLSWMDIDQSTGHIYIVFYDRRNTSGNETDVYLAISRDGGDTFKNIKINDVSFTPNTFAFFGDYNDISAVNGKIRPIWTQQNGAVLSVWTAIIDLVEGEK